MKIKTISLLVLAGLFPGVLAAEDPDLQTRIDDVNGQIRMEQEANQNLKDDIAARDREVAELKQKLKELEQKAAAQGK
ncbi:MAG: hypothetical protein ACRESK_06920 [Gammaproteobacteria bacterium]